MIKGMDVFYSILLAWKTNIFSSGGAAEFLHRLTVTRNDLEQLGSRRKPDEIIQLLSVLIGK